MYKLPALPYYFQDLEPFIDTHTMGLHYHKHQQNYLNKLNSLLIKNGFDFKYNINELICHLDEFCEDKKDILYNLGGVINHNAYFRSINTPYLRKMPQGKLLEKINETFNNFDDFYDLFKESALAIKGSGYTFLVINKNKDLEIVNMKNQKLPIFDGYIPLIALDMWEHAYYLNYENDKGKYIDNFKEIVDFTYANKLFESIKK